MTNAFSMSLDARSRARQARNSRSIHEPRPINSLPDPRWDTYFQMLQDRGVSKMADASVGAKRGMFPAARAPYAPTGPNAIRPQKPIQSHPTIGGDMRSMMPTTTYGADAEIARRSRELALQGLEAGREQFRLAGEPQAWQQQRRNIGAHGTIEAPNEFALRMGREGAAELTDPSTPRGALREQEVGEKLEGIYRQNVLPAQIGAQSRLGVADINAGADRYAADRRTEAAQAGDMEQRRAAALRALTDLIGFDTSEFEDTELDELEDARRRARNLYGDDIELR